MLLIHFSGESCPRPYPKGSSRQPRGFGLNPHLWQGENTSNEDLEVWVVHTEVSRTCP